MYGNLAAFAKCGEWTEAPELINARNQLLVNNLF
jgi:hypothetical protein